MQNLSSSLAKNNVTHSRCVIACDEVKPLMNPPHIVSNCMAGVEGRGGRAPAPLLLAELHVSELNRALRFRGDLRLRPKEGAAAR